MAEAIPPEDDGGSVAAGSEVLFDIVCFTCNSIGEIREAVGYCKDCGEHLCTTCLRYHKIQSATKHHILLDKDNMPGKQENLEIGDICTERCKIHKDEIIKYYCPEHDEFGCSTCVILRHKKCEKTYYIPDEAKGIENDQTFKDFQTTVDSLIGKSQDIIKSSEMNVKVSNEYRKKAIQKIEIHRQEVNAVFDNIKDVLEQQALDIETTDVEEMNSIAKHCNDALNELQQMSLDMQESLNKKQHCKLFIEAKKNGPRLKELQEVLAKTKQPLATTFRFKRSEELHNVLAAKEALGTIVVKKPMDVNATHLTDISIKSTSDSSTCFASAVEQLSHSKLLIADKNNKSVKLIDIETNEILSEYKSEHEPFDLTVVDEVHVFVTIPENKEIIVLRVGDNLNIERTIRCDAKCWSIVFINSKIMVSFSNPTEIRILNMNGDVYHLLYSDKQGDKLFFVVPFLTKSELNEFVYATDWKRKRITMFDLDGNVTGVHEDPDFAYPRFTAVDDMGMVYVCNRDKNNIHVFIPNAGRVKILLDSNDGIRKPRSICYCDTTHKLYVGFKGDNVKVYQLS